MSKKPLIFTLFFTFFTTMQSANADKVLDLLKSQSNEEKISNTIKLLKDGSFQIDKGITFLYKSNMYDTSRHKVINLLTQSRIKTTLVYGKEYHSDIYYIGVHERNYKYPNAIFIFVKQ